MGARANEVIGVALNLLHQQEIATDMAFAMIGPFAFERVVKPFGAKRYIVGD